MQSSLVRDRLMLDYSSSIQDALDQVLCPTYSTEPNLR